MPDTVLLLHGAWQGSWVWASQTPALEAAGLSPVALDLPGNGSDGIDPADVIFDEHVFAAQEALLQSDDPVAIVAHSGAGVLATQLAELHPARVRQIVHVAGMMLPTGITFPEFTAPFVEQDEAVLGIAAHLTRLPGASAVPPDAAKDIFYHDCPADAAAAAAARLTPQGEAVRAPRVDWTEARAGRVPRVYLRCGADRSVLPVVQDAMCDRWPGAEVHELGTGHAPMLAAPERLAAMLVDLLKRPLDVAS